MDEDKKKILIVEDEQSIAELERDYLELSGFSVTITEDGEKGLDKALNDNYDLIILDLMLPGRDGFEICKDIRSVKDIPIIIVSARKDDIDKIRGLGLGADDYMTKPFSASELVARVKALLRRSEILREKIFYTAGKSSLSGESAEIFTPDKPRDLNGGENQQLCGDDEEKCGNLVMNYAARRVYVIDFRKELHNDGFRKKENVEKNTKKPGLKGTDIMEVQLTPMEFDFLYYLILRKETAVSKAELLENVWHFPDAELREDVRMTDDLLKRLRKKLKAAGSSARVETVWGFGYRLTEN